MIKHLMHLPPPPSTFTTHSPFIQRLLHVISNLPPPPRLLILRHHSHIPLVIRARILETRKQQSVNTVVVYAVVVDVGCGDAVQHAWPDLRVDLDVLGRVLGF